MQTDKKKILLVSVDKSFMVNAIIKNLTDASYQVVWSSPDEEEIQNREEADAFLVYLEDGNDALTETIKYLKNLQTLNQSSALLYIIGNENELEHVNAMIPALDATRMLKRPLNVKMLEDFLQQDFAQDNQKTAKKTLLIVDDDSVMLRTLKVWLSERYTVYMANSGMNAIALLSKKKIDLILLDYEMPVLDGPKVLEMLRQEPSTKDIPVMFLTGKDDKESVMNVMALKPERYLLKNQPPETLLQNIEEYFSSKQHE